MPKDKAAPAAGSGPSTAMSTRLFENAWFSRILLTSQTIFLRLLLGFRPFCVCVALFWLFFRASQILQKPLAELSSLLGFDIPCNPIVNLASIKADGAIVHWSLPEKPKHKSQLKVEIHLNGTIIDQLSWHESAVTISGLQPSSFYVVRIACIQNEFSSKSSAIRFRTKPATSDDFFCAAGDGTDTDHDTAHEPVPRIQPHRGLKDFVPSTSASTVMSRELSSGLGVTRNANRRLSPAAMHADETQLAAIDFQQQPDTVQGLTEKLEAIRKETEDVERLAKEEDEDELRQKEELIRERDGLKAGMNDKDKTSRNLKREINTLERQNTAAQAERIKQERLLQAKHQERQRLKDDVVRWHAESVTMNDDIERARQQKTLCVDELAEEKVALKEKQAEEAERVRIVDDEVKEKAAEIKKLERVMKDGSPNGIEGEPNLVQQLQTEAEEERKWQALRHGFQQQYSILFKQMEMAKAYHAEQLRYLESLRAERRRQDEMAQYTISIHDRRPQRADSQRSRNAQSRHSVSDSPRLGAFPLHHSPFGNHANPSPFFNIQNGMTLAGPTDDVAMSDEERERLTGGALMSPNAGASLIPTDLFSNEVDTSREDVRPLPGLGALPGLPGIPGLPGLPNFSSSAQQDPAPAGPVSPTASSSRSPSLFASPQASQQNLYIGPNEHVIDADRRSIRSTRSNRAPSGGTTSRFSSILGIKPRNKNPVEEGLALSKASSMPRQDQGIPGLDSTTRKRNSSISGGLLGCLDGEVSGSGDGVAAATGRRGFGSFWNRGSAWPTTTFGKKAAPPRPGSTHSTELPRPSSDASRWGGADTWSLSDATAGARGSPLAFGTGWNAPPQQSRIYGSRHPSRRQSVQYASSGPPEDIMEDEDTDALDPNETANLAPIGTKPSKKSAAADNNAKLNPNAKDFKSFFANMKFGSKDKGRDSGESSEKNDFAGFENEESPPNSRKSRDTRDARSMTTEDSSLIESSRNSADLVRTPSHTNSDVPTPSPSLHSRESFMTRLTRKSSTTNKFSLPSFKRERSRLDPPTASSPLPPAEDESADGMSESVGSLKDTNSSLRVGGERDSKEGSRSSRSWSSAFKLGKKKTNETPSLSDRISMASGTEDGEDEEE